MCDHFGVCGQLQGQYQFITCSSAFTALVCSSSQHKATLTGLVSSWVDCYMIDYAGLSARTLPMSVGTAKFNQLQKMNDTLSSLPLGLVCISENCSTFHSGAVFMNYPFLQVHLDGFSLTMIVMFYSKYYFLTCRYKCRTH